MSSGKRNSDPTGSINKSGKFKKRAKARRTTGASPMDAEVEQERDGGMLVLPAKKLTRHTQMRKDDEVEVAEDDGENETKKAKRESEDEAIEVEDDKKRPSQHPHTRVSHAVTLEAEFGEAV